MARGIKLAEEIKRLRKAKKLSQEQIADMLDISQNAYSKIERGETEMSAKRMFDIATILEVHWEYLMKFVDRDDKDYPHYIAPINTNNISKNNFNTATHITNLERIIHAQEETIQLLKEKIAMLESKNKE